MEQGINLISIYITNAIGVVIVSVIAASNRWLPAELGRERRCIRLIMLTSLISCIVDPLIFSIDGQHGAWVRIFIYAESTWLYAANIIASLAWIYFIEIHLNGKISKANRIIILSAAAFETIMLIVNLFVPVIFVIDADNVYHRLHNYWIYAAISLFFICDAAIIYHKVRKKGGSLKYFPLEMYVIPILIGAIIQSFNYGVSVIWPFMTISVCGVILSLKNELIYTDSLTGLYSRAYLDQHHGGKEFKNMAISGIMIDMNDFKSINDRFGHSVGDDALRIVAELLKSAVSSMGTVLRYAGDEFIVLLNTQSQADIAACEKNIEHMVDSFNRDGGKPYELSLSMGSCSYEPDTMDFYEFIDKIDAHMYEKKRAYYAEHAEMNRRRSDIVR